MIFANRARECGLHTPEPLSLTQVNDLEVMVMEHVTPTGELLTVSDYLALIAPLRNVPTECLPVFTNWAKAMSRTSPGDVMRERYADAMNRLFDVATEWSAVHGDMHGGNAFHTANGTVIVDFDTACASPAVWEWTHLLTRAGTVKDAGICPRELHAALTDMFSEQEIRAAVELRSLAREIAAAHRHRFSDVASATHS